MNERTVFYMKKTRYINIERDKRLLSVVAIIFSLYTAFSITYFSATCGTVRENVVRLHVIANSDSPEDQRVKLQVRDALLKRNCELLSDKVNTENAHLYFSASKDDLREASITTLRENNFPYDAKVSLEREYYETRQYGELTFPAGEYLSLKVVLGEGKGKNWWCVMFPPLCIPVAGDIKTQKEKTADYISPKGEEIINGGNEYVMKFKIVEIYEELKSKF